MEKEKRYEVLQKSLKEHLNEEETVLWHGWTEPFKMLEGKDGKRIIRNWVIAVAAFSGFFAAYASANETWDMTLTCAVLLAMLAMLCTPYMRWKKLQKQHYWITNQRILVNEGNAAFLGIDMDLVEAADVAKIHTGNSCVMLGKKIVNEGSKQLRWRSTMPAIGSSADEVGMVFYNVDPERAQEALEVFRRIKYAV